MLDHFSCGVGRVAAVLMAISVFAAVALYYIVPAAVRFAESGGAIVNVLVR